MGCTFFFESIVRGEQRNRDEESENLVKLHSKFCKTLYNLTILSGYFSSTKRELIHKTKSRRLSQNKKDQQVTAVKKKIT